MKAIKGRPVQKVQGKPKNKLSFDEKSALVISALKAEQRRAQVFCGRDDIPPLMRNYSMMQIAKLAGYSRSTRFMLFLYEMCDRGMLAKSEWASYDRCGRGICDVNIQFCLPEYARSKVQKNMFTVPATGEGE